MINKNSSDFAIWQYLSALYFFANGYLFCLHFVVKKTDVRYRLNVKWRRLIRATLSVFGLYLDYNSYVSWWIFTLLAPIETGTNTLSGNYKLCNFIVSLQSTLPKKI